jgi:prophage tail gpP-like protein
MSERWAGQKVRWPIVEEDACTLVVDGETLITGFVDQARARLERW